MCIRDRQKAPGEALADFFIFKLVADAWGCADLFEAWRTPEDVFGILTQLSAGQPCDISGLPSSGAYAFLDANGGVQWPFPPGTSLDDAEHPTGDSGHASAGCSPTAGSSPPTSGRGSSPTTPSRRASGPTTATRSCC